MDSVSKEAREAAADLLSGGGIAGHDRYTSEVREGLHDSAEEYVQAFARFQEATRLAVVEEVREEFGRIKGYIEHDRSCTSRKGAHYGEENCDCGLKEALTAIRALQPKVAGQ